MTQIPPAIETGDLLYAMNVAGALRPPLFEQGLARLRDRGFRVAYDPTMGTDGRYLAGDDASRVADLRAACERPGARGIIAARGGFGTTRILSQLADLELPEDRWLIGYSDITALHAWAWRQKKATIHGPMVSGIGAREDTFALDELLATAAGKQRSFEGLEPVRPGAVTGTLIGGNLSMVLSILGTRWLPDLAGKIVFIEEIGEPLYRVDRMLTELAERTRQHPPAAIIAGQFTNCGKGHAKLVDELLRERLRAMNIPAAIGLPVGHAPQTHSIICNVSYAFDGRSLHLDRGQGDLEPAPACSSQEHENERFRPTRIEREEQTPIPVLSTSRPFTSPGPVHSVIDEALRSGVCSAVQLEVSVAGERLLSVAAGRTGVTDDCDVDAVNRATVFDIASLTKALSTATIFWQEMEKGNVSLEDTAPAAVAEEPSRLIDLLRHSSGLPGYRRIYPDLRANRADVAATRAAFRQTRLMHDVGTSDYSDPGYIQLGMWLEALTGERLDTLFSQRVATPLGLTRTGFRPIDSETGTTTFTRTPNAPAHRGHSIAATEFCAWRGATLQGTVHDEHAQLLGGVAGHAGLFSTASEVCTIGDSLLGYGPALLKPETVDRMWSREHRVGSFVCGWDTPSGPRSNAGSLMRSDCTVGHLGFTGTSVWVEREREVVIVMLTNRVHPTRMNESIRAFRPALHDAVMKQLFGSHRYATP